MRYICSRHGHRRRQQGREKAGGRKFGGHGPKMGRSTIKVGEEVFLYMRGSVHRLFYFYYILFIAFPDRTST